MQVHDAAREVREQGWKQIESSGQNGLTTCVYPSWKLPLSKEILQYNLKVTKRCAKYGSSLRYVARQILECKIAWQNNCRESLYFCFFPTAFAIKKYDFEKCRNRLITPRHLTGSFFLKKRLSLVRDAWYTKFCLWPVYHFLWRRSWTKN